MCGRFTLRSPADTIASLFDTLPVAGFHYAARFNIAPTQNVPVVYARDDRRHMSLMHWGLIPSWSKEPKAIYGTINARPDTLASKPAFRSAYKSRRCLVIADGYYEWKAEGKKKQPYLYEIEGGKPFAFAGLWEQWWGEDKDATPLESCTIITTEANKLASEIHNRMPVILSPNDYDLWLDPTVKDTAKVAPLLDQFPEQRMSVRAVSTFVNNARNEGPECCLNSA